MNTILQYRHPNQQELTSDLEKFAGYIAEHLAAYALPRFIRIVKQSLMTPTFKQVKIKLKKGGLRSG